jgi:hypothetical protein
MECTVDTLLRDRKLELSAITPQIETYEAAAQTRQRQKIKVLKKGKNDKLSFYESQKNSSMGACESAIKEVEGKIAALEVKLEKLRQDKERKAKYHDDMIEGCFEQEEVDIVYPQSYYVLKEKQKSLVGSIESLQSAIALRDKPVEDWNTKLNRVNKTVQAMCGLTHQLYPQEHKFWDDYFDTLWPAEKLNWPDKAHLYNYVKERRSETMERIK